MRVIRLLPSFGYPCATEPPSATVPENEVWRQPTALVIATVVMTMPLIV